MIIEEAYTFDDVLLQPGHSKFGPAEAEVKTSITKNINLNIPLLSAAMDTVTEHRLAINMAQLGGIGVLHKNFSIDDQASEVQKVKKFEAGMVVNPVTIKPDQSLGEAFKLMKENKISGIPVVEGLKNKLVGILTNRDVRFANDLNQPISALMTRDVVTVKENVSREEARKLLHKHRIEKLVVVDEEGFCVGLITVKDMEKAQNHPDACKDAQGRLRVAAATGVGSEGIARAEALIDAGVDVLIVDTAHGHSQMVLDTVKAISKLRQKVELIGGNVATADATKALIDCGADGVKVGIGPGSICTTRLVAGIGVPQLSAILAVRNGLKNKKAIIISDGGIKYSGDLAKAFAAGADAVMIGSLFAGTDETPGKLIMKNGKKFKSFRGMGSVGAMNKGSADRYFQKKQKDASKYVPEGVEGFVKYKGKVADVLYKLVGGLKSSMGYLGAKQIKNLRDKPRFVKITKAGFYESMVHNVDQIKDDRKY